MRFAETDAQGIAHHAAYVVWLEVARVAYLADHAGGYRAIQERGIEALTTGVHLDYHRPAYFDDLLRCTSGASTSEAHASATSTASSATASVVATGHTNHATVSRETHAPTRVPDWFAAAVATAQPAS